MELLLVAQWVCIGHAFTDWTLIAHDRR